MPTYVFYNKKTKKYWEELMPISVMETLLEENPHLQLVPQAPKIVTGVSITDKTDDGWKETLSRVADANPYSTFAKTHGQKDSKSVVRRKLYDKHIGSKRKR